MFTVQNSPFRRFSIDWGVSNKRGKIAMADVFGFVVQIDEYPFCAIVKDLIKKNFTFEYAIRSAWANI